MLMRATHRRGQVTVEAAILFTFVIAALVAMSIYLQRGVQGGAKSNADSLGTQFSATQPWSSTATSNTTENQTTVTSTQNTGYSQTVQ